MDQQNDNDTQNNNQPGEGIASYNEVEATTPVQNTDALTPEASTDTNSAYSETPTTSDVNNTPPVAEPITPAVEPVSETPIQQPAVPTTPFSEPPAQKSRKKWLIPVAIGGALLLFGGGASAYYVGVYQSPEKVMFDAYSNLVSAKHLQVDGNVDFDMDSIMGVKLKSIQYASKADAAPGAELDVTAKLVVMSEDIEVGGKGIFTDNGDLYFQINGLKDALKSIANSTGVGSDVRAGYYAALEKLQDQWVKVTNADLKKQGEDYAKAYQCVVDTTKKHKDSDSKELLQMYKDNPFIEKKEDLGYKDGNIGYRINFDETKFKDFTKAAQDTAYIKDLKKCTDDLDDQVVEDIDSTGVDALKLDDDSSIAIWIDQWSHKLKHVEYSTGTKTDSYKLNAKGLVSFGYDSSITIKAPDNSITLQEFIKRSEEVTSQLNASGSNALNDNRYSDSLSSEL